MLSNEIEISVAAGNLFNSLFSSNRAFNSALRCSSRDFAFCLAFLATALFFSLIAKESRINKAVADTIRVMPAHLLR